MRLIARDLVQAMRADHLLAPQSAGLWYIQRFEIPAQIQPVFAAEYDTDGVPFVTTSLVRWTDATIHLGHGETVMSDNPKELRRHLPAVLAAHGRVLVSGLGLGCVVRGLLANPRVSHIDVVEIDRHVLEMVGGSFDGEPRVAMHHGDARTYRWPAGTRWDLAWHDVWDERDALDLVHAELLARYRRRVAHQGAWQFPRWTKRIWPDVLVNAPACVRKERPA